MYEQVSQTERTTVSSLQQENVPAYKNSCRNVPSSGVLVFAFGNPLRSDDGIGPAVLQALGQYDRLSPEAMLLEGDAWTLASLIQSKGFRRVILLDAMEMEGSPGDWQRFYLNVHGSYAHKARLQADTHHLNLDTMLALLEILGSELPEFIVYGVQPQSMNWSENLSESVQLIVPTLCKQILKDLEEG